MSAMVREIFEEVALNDEQFFSFTTEHDLDNIESMSLWLEDNELGEWVVENNDTMVILSHDDYDEFDIRVDSYGEGDFFSHGISCMKITKEEWK